MDNEDLIMTALPHDRIEHLKLIQNIITRMAGNSAQMKTWAVSLVTAVFVLSGVTDTSHWLMGLGGAIAVVSLGIMDARYLRIERCYRKLYEAVVNDDGVRPFDLNHSPYVSQVAPVWRTVMSWSVSSYYGALLIAVLAMVGLLGVWGGDLQPVGD